MKTENYSHRHQWDQRLKLPLGSVEKAVHGSSDWVLAQLGKMDIDEYWANIGRKFNLAPQQTADFRTDFYRGDVLNYELTTWIRDIKQEHVVIGLLSNNSIDLLDTIKTLGVGDLFDEIVISAQVGVMKPSPEIYECISVQLNVPAENSLFIDDFETNVNGARQFGMNALLYKTNGEIETQATLWLTN